MLQMISAVDARLGIGKNNRLLAHIPQDLRRFKQLTQGHPMIMGRATFESLPGVLPGRTHVVLSRQERESTDERVRWIRTPREALATAQSSPGGEVVSVVGGAQVYAEFLAQAQRLYLTEIDFEYAADTYFPAEYRAYFGVEHRSEWSANSGVRFRFVDYVRP